MLRTLQACRAFAALLVVFYHTSNSFFILPKYFNSRPFGHLPDFGHAGVNLFFVLSGFIILHVHRVDIGRPQRLMHYLGRRTRRIYPTYWVVLAVLIPLYFVVPSLGNGTQRDPVVIVRSILLLPQARLDIEPVLGVAWTLIFEMFFYLLFATFLIRRSLGWLALSTWLVLLYVKPWQDRYPFDFICNVYHFGFLAGMLTAEFVHRVRNPVPRLTTALGLTLFLATGLTTAYAPDVLSPTLWLTGYAVGGSLLIAGAVAWEKTAPVPIPRLVAFLGDASYSIYLVHQAALSVLAKAVLATHLHTRVPHVLLFVAMMMLATLAGVALHLFVERPLMRLGKKSKPEMSEQQRDRVTASRAA